MQQESVCVLGFFNVCVVFYGKTVLSNIFRWAADLRLLELFTASGKTFLNFCHLMGCLREHSTISRWKKKKDFFVIDTSWSFEENVKQDYFFPPREAPKFTPAPKHSEISEGFQAQLSRRGSLTSHQS